MIIVNSPRFDLRLGIGQGEELLHVQALVPRRPLNDSMYAFSTGLPGRMKSSCMPRRYAQSSSARDMNSVP